MANAAPDAAALQATVDTEDVEGGAQPGRRRRAGHRRPGLRGQPHPGAGGAQRPQLPAPPRPGGDLHPRRTPGNQQAPRRRALPPGPGRAAAKLSRKAMLDYVGRHWDDRSDPAGSAHLPPDAARPGGAQGAGRHPARLGGADVPVAVPGRRRGAGQGEGGPATPGADPGTAPQRWAPGWLGSCRLRRHPLRRATPGDSVMPGPPGWRPRTPRSIFYAARPADGSTADADRRR